MSVDYSRFRWSILEMAGARDLNLIQAFAEVLRMARHTAGLSQEQLAHEAEVDRTYIGLIENAKRQPSLSAIFAIARALSVPVDQLIAEVDARAAGEALQAQSRRTGTPPDDAA